MTTTVFARTAAINRADANANALANLTKQGGRRRRRRTRKTKRIRKRKTRRRRSFRGGVAGIVTQYKPMSVPYSESGSNTIGGLHKQNIEMKNQGLENAKYDHLK